MGVVIFCNQKSQVRVLSVTVKYLNDCHAEEAIDLFCATRIQKLVQNNEELFYLTNETSPSELAPHLSRCSSRSCVAVHHAW